MTSLKKSVRAIAAAVALTLSVSAQQLGTSNQTQGSQSMEGMQGMEQGGRCSQTKNNMMQCCQKNMQTLMQSNGQLKKTIADAKASNDPTKMQSALSDAEKYVDSRNDHMETCMSMMNMPKPAHYVFDPGRK